MRCGEPWCISVSMPYFSCPAASITVTSQTSKRTPLGLVSTLTHPYRRVLSSLPSSFRQYHLSLSGEWRVLWNSELRRGVNLLWMPLYTTNLGQHQSFSLRKCEHLFWCCRSLTLLVGETKMQMSLQKANFSWSCLQKQCESRGDLWRTVGDPDRPCLLFKGAVCFSTGFFRHYLPHPPVTFEDSLTC